MSKEKGFVIADVLPGKLNALVKNLMLLMGVSDPNEAVRRINSREWVVAEPERKWRKGEGIIYLTVTSDGTTGPEWIERFKERGFKIGDSAERILRSSGFEPTNGVTTEVVIFERSSFRGKSFTTDILHAEARRRDLIVPNAEIACLIRDKFSDEEIDQMGLTRIVPMHEPIESSSDYQGLLSANRYGYGPHVVTSGISSDREWSYRVGAAFVVWQTSSES